MEQTIYIHLHKAPPPKGKIFLGEMVFGETNDSSFRLSNFLARSARLLAAIGLMFIFLSFAPSIWYSVKAHGIETISQLLAKPVVSETNSFNYQKDFTYQPKIDPSLPLEARIIIPSIGIDAEIQESTLDNYEEALKRGIWRVPDFGTPYSRNKPTIMAAHRFGYLAWTNIFRRKNSFFNLPKLKEGEIIEIIWRQRKYVYEVYDTGEGEEIIDYSADLILYTCKSLTSPIRIFKYARLLKI